MSLSKDKRQTQATMKEGLQARTSVGTLMPSDRIYTGTDNRSTVFEDSAFFEDEETNTPRKDYEDFILFPDTDQFFADANVSVVGDQGPIYNGKENCTHQVGKGSSHTDILATSPRSHFYDAVRDAVQRSINEAVTAVLVADSNNQIANPQCLPPTPYLRPVELWSRTVHRHESIAYRFEQSPQQVIRARLRETRS